MTSERVKNVAEPHFQGHDMDVLASDVVYVDVNAGEEHVGRDEAAALTAYYNEEVFEALGGEVLNTVFDPDGTAVFELAWRGKHVGEFEGVEPTGREVEGQVCIVATVEGDRITEAHLYFPRQHILTQIQE